MIFSSNVIVVFLRFGLWILDENGWKISVVVQQALEGSSGIELAPLVESFVVVFESCLD